MRSGVQKPYPKEIMDMLSKFPFGFRIAKPDETVEFIVVVANGLLEAEQQVAEIYIDHDDYEITNESLIYIIEKQYNGIVTLSPTVI